MTLGERLHLHKKNAANTTTTAQPLAGTPPLQQGFVQKEVLTFNQQGTTVLPAQTFNSSPILAQPVIDTSLRSTNLPVHTNPGAPVLLNQGPLLNQGLGLQQPAPLLNQGLGFQQPLNQGLGLQQHAPLLNQGLGFQQPALATGYSTPASQSGLGLNHGLGVPQTGFGQGLVNNQGPLQQALHGLPQPNVFVNSHGILQQGHAGPMENRFRQGHHVPQTGVAPMHTAAGHHAGLLPTNAALPATALAGGHPTIAHQPLLVNKKLRSTISDTSLVQQPILLQQLQQQQFVAPVMQQRSLPVQQQIPVETHVRPTIIDEVQRSERLVEVQPIIHREIEAPEVHVIEQHIYESVPSTGPSVINRPAIVEEVVRPRIIEEIQPVVHREVPQAFIEHVEQHINERVVQPTTMTKEVMGLNQQQFVPAGGFVAAGGPALNSNLGGNIPVPPPMPSNVSSSTRRL